MKLFQRANKIEQILRKASERIEVVEYTLDGVQYRVPHAKFKRMLRDVVDEVKPVPTYPEVLEDGFSFKEWFKTKVHNG